MHHGGIELLVMRHGPAESGAGRDDASRRLTPQGRKQTRLAANALARLVAAPARIYSSELVRARETAEILAVAAAAPAPVVTPLLNPGFDPRALVHELVHSGRDSLAIVGHEPDLSHFAGRLVAGTAGARLHLGKASACLLRLEPDGTAVLHALYPRQALIGFASA